MYRGKDELVRLLAILFSIRILGDMYGFKESIRPLTRSIFNWSFPCLGSDLAYVYRHHRNLQFVPSFGYLKHPIRGSPCSVRVLSMYYFVFFSLGTEKDTDASIYSSIIFFPCLSSFPQSLPQETYHKMQYANSYMVT